MALCMCTSFLEDCTALSQNAILHFYSSHIVQYNVLVFFCDRFDLYRTEFYQQVWISTICCWTPTDCGGTGHQSTWVTKLWMVDIWLWHNVIYVACSITFRLFCQHYVICFRQKNGLRIGCVLLSDSIHLPVTWIKISSLWCRKFSYLPWSLD